ncbi:MAG: DUF4879 domain-containing protein [Exilibacterium sp.]
MGKNYRLKNIFVTIITAFLFLTNFTFAADIQKGVVQKDLSSSVPAFMGKVDSSLGDLSSLPQTEDFYSRISVYGPASGITFFEVGVVYSTTYGNYEIISSSQPSTIYNHGGSHLYIYVWQFGYGNPNNATMNGISKAPGLSEPRCGSNLHVCSSGETVTGWLYGWDYSGQSAGTFTASANSTASPFGYWSDSLYIQ